MSSSRSTYRAQGSSVNDPTRQGRHARSSSPNQRTPRGPPPRAPSPSFGPRRPPLHPSTPKLATGSPRRASPSRKASPPAAPPLPLYVQEIDSGDEASPPPAEIDEPKATRIRESPPKFRNRADSFGSDAGVSVGDFPNDITSDGAAMMVSAATTKDGSVRIGETPMEEMMRHERKYFRSTLPKKLVNPCGCFCRIVSTVIWIAISIIVSASVYTQSTGWVEGLTCIQPAHTYGAVPGYSKVFAAWDVTGTHDTIEGTRCRVWFQFDPRVGVSQTAVRAITQYSIDTGALCGYYSEDEFGGDCAGGHCWTCISSIPCTHTVGQSVPIGEDSEVSWTDQRFPVFYPNSSAPPLELRMDDDHEVIVNNAVIGLEPVCSVDGNVTPGHIIVVQGFIITGMLLVLFVIIREMYLWWCKIQQNHKRAVDCSVIACHMHEVRREMRRRVEGQWETEAVRRMVDSQRHAESEGERRDGSLSPGARGFSADQDSPSGLRSNVQRHFEHGSILSHDPSPTAMLARAHSTTKFGIGAMNPLCRDRAAGWDVQVKNMRVGLRRRQRTALVRGVLKTMIRAFLFLILHILACLFVFAVSPRQLFDSSWWSILDAARGIQQVGTGSPWVFTDLLVLVDVALLILMAIPSAVRASWWPRGDFKSDRMTSSDAPTKRAHEFSPLDKSARQMTVVDQDVCVIIVIRSGSCADFTKRKRIAKLVRRCENLFPCEAPGFSRVFVVDHGTGLMPADDCWKMLQDTVSPHINYAYLPEDDKAVAIHWANKSWVSSQVRRYNANTSGPKVAIFRYAMVIDDVDGVDDFLLPTSMDVDVKEIASKGVNLVWFPSTVRPVVQGQDQSVWVDDYLLKKDSIVSLTQEKLGRSAVVTPQKCVCLWNRRVLYEVMERMSGSDGKDMTNAELTQRMSIEQMKMKGASSMMAAPQVRVTNHDQFGSHCREWRILCTLMLESINPFVCTASRWAAKLWILLYYVVPAFFIITRPFYLGTLLLRAPIDIPILLAIYYVILNVLSVSLTLLALRKRPEIKRHWTIPLLLFVLPLYKLAYDIAYLHTSLFHTMFKLCASYPSIREGEKKPCGAGVPPLPGSSTVDWFSVWVTEDEIEVLKGRGKSIHKSGGAVWVAPEKGNRSGVTVAATGAIIEYYAQHGDEGMDAMGLEENDLMKREGKAAGNTSSDDSFFEGEYSSPVPARQPRIEVPRYRADTFRSDGGDSDFNSDAEGSVMGDADLAGRRGRVVGPAMVASDRSFGAILKQERQYLLSRTPPPFLSPLPEILRVIGSIIALILAVGVAVTAMVGSINWITALNCPYPAIPFAASENIDGLYCRVRVSYSSVTQQQQDWATIYSPYTTSVANRNGNLGCTQISNNEVSCLSAIPCDFAVQLSSDGTSCPANTILWTEGEFNDNILPFGGSCQYLLALDLQQYLVSGAGISVEPFCTANGDVPPGKVIIANALLVLCAGWVIFIVIGEIRVYVKRQRKARLEEVDRKVMEPKLPGVHAAYRRRVQASWTEQANREHRRLMEKQAEEQHSDTDSVKSPQSVFSVDLDSPSGLRSNVHMAFEHGNLQDLAGGLVKTVDESGNPIHPYARFQSKEWRARVSVALLEIRYRAKMAVKRGVLYWSLTMVLGWILLFLCCLLVVGVFPNQIYQNSGKLDLLDYINNGADGESVPAVAVIDWLVILDGLILTILAFLPALLSSRWPSLPTARRSSAGRSMSESGNPVAAINREEIADEDVTDVCVIMALHSGCCTDPIKRARVRKILRRCTSLFPPKVHGCSPIFVVEVGNELAPADDCCKMIQDSVSPDINYAYLPEDNKSMAIYWANKSWVPSVLRYANPQENRNSAFRYALLITDADSDDDLMLPVALDLNTQDYRRHGIKVVWYMPTVRGVSNMPLVTMEDYMVKQRAIMSFTQEKLGGSCVVTPLKSVMLWDRAALHRTLAGFMGINADDAPGFLQPSLMMDRYLRHDFETSLGGSQPALIGVYFGIYFVVFHGISVALMAITLRNRRDVRRQWNWFVATVMLPFYKIYQYVMDVYPALLHVMFSIRKIPGGRQNMHTGTSVPLPPAKDVDWFTVWKSGSDTSASNIPGDIDDTDQKRRDKRKKARR
ncbi:hypothetical protein FOL47_002385 [Perkinsus chesapeaki]|uniref:Uncharacterized protein n=1 Tax=Perkinsus chesapeaki TaxID=330153 RepID=A0A7J6MDV2_PERCH|nr:hypothetical protein FOL47_002385 [Perkinsus chesapeaki]